LVIIFDNLRANADELDTRAKLVPRLLTQIGSAYLVFAENLAQPKHETKERDPPYSESSIRIYAYVTSLA
jgi:hypothetical protein